ncbi:MAG TPA: hypothetical protein VKX28_23695 [Xanthobacteraceae bacterium]|nr:hypothetical protein [Xanthobacteraceae bacterium]
MIRLHSQVLRSMLLSVVWVHALLGAALIAPTSARAQAPTGWCNDPVRGPSPCTRPQGNRGDGGTGCSAGEKLDSANGCIPANAMDCGNNTFCPAGQSCGSGQQCLSPGDDDCGDGTHCSGGDRCSRSKTFCLSPGSVDCGSYSCSAGDKCSVNGGCVARDDILCAAGNYCKPGEMCSRGGGCVPVGRVDCGKGHYCDSGQKCSGDGRCFEDLDVLKNGLERMRNDHASEATLLREADDVIEALRTYARLRRDKSVVARQEEATLKELVRLLIEGAQRSPVPDYAAIAKAYFGWRAMFGGDTRFALDQIRKRTRGQYSGMGGAAAPVGLDEESAPLSAAEATKLNNLLDRAHGIPSDAGSAADTGVLPVERIICWGDVHDCKQGFGFHFVKTPGELFLSPQQETPEMMQVREQLTKDETQLNDIRSGATPFTDPALRKRAEHKVLETLKQESLHYDELKQKKLKESEHGA